MSEKTPTKGEVAQASDTSRVRVNPDTNKNPQTAYTVRWREGGKTRVETIRRKSVSVPRQHPLVEDLLAAKLIVEDR